MADCPDFVIWNSVPAGSKLRAQSSATRDDTSSDDYDATVQIAPPSGSEINWVRADLDPGPAGPLALVAGAYGFTGTVTCGPGGPTAKLRIRIEGTEFDCTWTNASAGTIQRVNGTIVVVAQ